MLSRNGYNENEYAIPVWGVDVHSMSLDVRDYWRSTTLTRLHVSLLAQIPFYGFR